MPTRSPTSMPSLSPSSMPTRSPTSWPSQNPTNAPSGEPTRSSAPSAEPTTSSAPSAEPTSSFAPSAEPSYSSAPSVEPTSSLAPSSAPSTSASPTASAAPTEISLVSPPSPAPTAGPTPFEEGRLYLLQLINPDTGALVLKLKDGAEINLEELNLTSFNIQAFHAPMYGPVRSVKFDVNEFVGYSIGNSEPYMLCDGSCDDFGPGTYTITATPYPGFDATGTAGMPRVVTFSIVASSEAPTSSPTEAPSSSRAPSLSPSEEPTSSQAPTWSQAPTSSPTEAPTSSQAPTWSQAPSASPTEVAALMDLSKGSWIEVDANATIEGVYSRNSIVNSLYFVANILTRCIFQLVMRPALFSSTGKHF